MNSQIPLLPSATKEGLNCTRELDFAALCLADDCIPKLPGDHTRAFVDGDQRVYHFLFPISDRFAALYDVWGKCKAGQPVPKEESIVQDIWRAFSFYDRLVRLILAGKGSKRIASKQGEFWTTNNKVAAATLALSDQQFSDERLTGMIQRDGTHCGFLMTSQKLINAFLDPEAFCEANPNSRESAIVAAFFLRERLRSFVKALPAQHVFREVGEDGQNKITFIAEPETKTK